MTRQEFNNIFGGVDLVTANITYTDKCPFEADLVLPDKVYLWRNGDEWLACRLGGRDPWFLEATVEDEEPDHGCWSGELPRTAFESAHMTIPEALDTAKARHEPNSGIYIMELDRAVYNR